MADADPHGVGEVALHRDGAEVAQLAVNDHVEITDAQIGSMFVTQDMTKTVLGHLPDHSPSVVIDGQVVDVAWETAKIRVPLRLLSRWQQAKLQWAPMLRRVTVRFRRDGEGVTLRVRRRWPR